MAWAGLESVGRERYVAKAKAAMLSVLGCFLFARYKDKVQSPTLLIISTSP